MTTLLDELKVLDTKADKAQFATDFHRAENVFFSRRKAIIKVMEAAKNLAHYVKKAREGDSPLIHRQIVYAVDDALDAFTAAMQTEEGTRP